MDMDKKEVATKEELDARCHAIMVLHAAEMMHQSIINAIQTSTHEERCEALEDGYLAEFKMIKLAKTFTKEQYVEYQLERPCGCSYENLETPDYEDYIS